MEKEEETLVDVKVDRAILQEKLARIKKFLQYAELHPQRWGYGASELATYLLTTTFDEEE